MPPPKVTYEEIRPLEELHRSANAGGVESTAGPAVDERSGVEVHRRAEVARSVAGHGSAERGAVAGDAAKLGSGGRFAALAKRAGGGKKGAAIAAAAGRKKYGSKRMASMAAKGRKRAAAKRKGK